MEQFNKFTKEIPDKLKKLHIAPPRDWKPWHIAAITTASIAAVGVILRRKRRAKAKAQFDALRAQFKEDDEVILAQTPGKGTPIFHGVRVVEIGSVVAAPSCTMIMADLGAEVVKIEDTNGDYWRKLFLPYMKGRVFASQFELVNRGKKSVVLDLKTTDGMMQFKKILLDADVFVTNVRRDSLKSLGISYEELKEEFPGLIYAHITGWGRTGPDYKQPGYDIGCFWTASGLSGLCHPPGIYSIYPVAFGDKVTASSLMSAISIALITKLKTGHGQLVSTSLLQNGINSALPYMLDINEIADPVPRYKQLEKDNPFYEVYMTRDFEFIALLGLEDEEAMENALESSLNISLKDFEQSEKIEVLSVYFSKFDYAEISLILNSNNINFSKYHDMMKNGLPEKAFNSDAVIKIPGVTDLENCVNIPISLSASDRHGPRKRAPALGQSTQSFVKSGWSDRLPEAELNRDNLIDGFLSESENSAPLDGITVVELCGFQCNPSVTVSSACCRLADFGATIIKIEPTEGDCWRQNNVNFFNQLNRGKMSISFDQLGEDNVNLYSLLEKVDVFATNLSHSKLSSMGIDVNEIRERNPKLIIATSSSDGMDFTKIGGLGSFWLESGMACFITPSIPHPVARYPQQFGELMTGSYLLMGITAALFHRARTDEGQNVETSLLRAGLYAMSTTHSIVCGAPIMGKIYKRPIEDMHDCSATPTMNCFRTKDGYWVQLLGLNVGLHFPQCLKILQLRSFAYSRILYLIFTKVLFRSGSLYSRLQPVFKVMNKSLELGIGRMTWEELEELFTKHGIWYAPVNMPVQAKNLRQVRSLGIVTDHENQNLVAAPFDMSLYPEGHIPKALFPELGQDNFRIHELI